MPALFEYFQDKSAEYRWRLKSAHGQVIATGGGGYKNKSGAENGISAIKRDARLPRSRTSSLASAGLPAMGGSDGCR